MPNTKYSSDASDESTVLLYGPVGAKLQVRHEVAYLIVSSTCKEEGDLLFRQH